MIIKLGSPYSLLVLSVVVAVLTILGLAEVMAAGLFWAHLVLCFLMLASFLGIMVSFGFIVQSKGEK